MPVTIQEITTTDPRYAFTERLMAEAFPPVERRGSAHQRQTLDTDSLMHCCAIMHDGAIAGMLTWWRLGDIRYIEHFAVDAALRGSGIGAEALRQFLASEPSPVILEVEHPNGGMASRRIKFYERAGLRLWPDLGYVQPPYSSGAESVSMRLMATPDLGPEHFDKVTALLRRHVYRCSDCEES